MISTPAINGSNLPGITRKCIIDSARDNGYKVEERCIPVGELINADEVFCTGTAVVVEPVGSITYQDKRPLIALVFMGYFRILRHFHKSLGKITLV
ncbi:hypothetical protein Peur_010701 [Populus x canadensis]